MGRQDPAFFFLTIVEGKRNERKRSVPTSHQPVAAENVRGAAGEEWHACLLLRGGDAGTSLRTRPRASCVMSVGPPAV